MQVTRDEAPHADGVPRERRRDGAGATSSIEDVADDYVNCTMCGACELRCPNTLFTGDFYRFRTADDRRREGGADASPSRAASTSRTGSAGPSSPTAGATSRCSAGTPRRRQSKVRDWATGLDIPIGGETVLFADCEAAFKRAVGPARGRAAAPGRRHRVRPDEPAVVLRRPDVGDGLRRASRTRSPSTTSPTGARPGRSGSSASIRTTTSRSSSTTRRSTRASTSSRSFSRVELVAELIRDGQARADRRRSSGPSPTTTRAG